jgi:hypothetical protein
MALMPEHPDAEHEGATPSQRVSCMVDKKSMAHARECVRLAGLTDDQEVRDQLIALARDWIVAATTKKKKEEEEDDDSKVLVFPSAVERSRRKASFVQRWQSAQDVPVVAPPPELCGPNRV